MANVLGAFRYAGPDGLPIRVLDGDQNTGLFNHPAENGLPLEYLLTESHEVLGAVALGLGLAGQISLIVVGPSTTTLALDTRGQVGPHAAPTRLALQTFGDLTFAEARGHIAFALVQPFPGFLTPTAAHGDPVTLALATRADTGARGDAALALDTRGQVGPHGSTRLALATAADLSAMQGAATTFRLATAGGLEVAPAGNVPLALALTGVMEGAVPGGNVALALALAGVLRSDARGAVSLALQTAGAIPRDVVGGLALRLDVAGVLTLANNNVTGDAGLALGSAGLLTLANAGHVAALAAILTLHPSVMGQPGGTAYE